MYVDNTVGATTTVMMVRVLVMMVVGAMAMRVPVRVVYRTAYSTAATRTRWVLGVGMVSDMVSGIQMVWMGICNSSYNNNYHHHSTYCKTMPTNNRIHSRFESHNRYP